jgi:hypothetical protein
MKNREEKIKKLKELALKDYGDEYDLILIPEEMTKRVVAYTSMRNDLELVLKYLNFLKSTEDKAIESAMTYAVIALYGKCFTDSKDGFPQLNSLQIFDKDKKEMETHEYLMDLRHKFIAHRSETENEIGMAYIAVLKDEPNRATMKCYQMKLANFSIEKIEELEACINFVLKKVIEKFEKSGNKLYDGVLNKFSFEELRNFSFSDDLSF